MMMMGLFLLALPFGVFGAIDAACRPWNHWERVGGDKPGWISLQILVFIPIVNLVGLVAAILYFTRTRPKLKAAARELSTL